MPGLVDADGNAIPEAQEHEAWSNGTAHVLPGTTVHLVDATGTLRAVPAEQVAKARAQGMVPAAAKVVEEHQLQKEHGSIGAQLGTTAESAADMATIGGYGYAAGKLSPEYAKNLLARREANPTAHVAGSVLGLAPSLLTGGEGAIAEGAELLGGAGEAAEGLNAAAHAAEGGAGAAEAAGGLLNTAKSAGIGAATVAGAPIRAVGALGGIVERGVQRGLASLGADGSSLAGRVAAKALASGAAGATEGAAFGVGSALSESSLEGKDLTSEALVSSIGRNALFGGALGAGMSSIAELGGAGIKAVLPDTEKLEKFGREQGLRSIGANDKDIQKLGSKLDMTADELMSYEFKTGPNVGKRMFSAATNAKEMAENLAQAAQETGTAKRGIVDEIDEAIRTKPDVAAVAQPDVGEFFQRVNDQVIAKLRASKSPTIARMANKVERELAPLRAEYEAAQTHAADAAAGVGKQEVGVNVGSFDAESMRPESNEYVKANHATLEPPRIEIYPDGMGVGDGRHRLQAAYERGERSMSAKVVRYDAEGNKLSEAIEPVSLRNEPGGPVVSQQPASAPEPITFAKLDQFKQDLGKVIYGEGVKGAGIQVAPKAAKQLDKVRGILADFQSEAAQKALAAMGEDSATYATLNRQYSTLTDLKKIADRTAGRMDANRMSSPTDHALGLGGMVLSMLSGNVGALGATAFGGAAALANKFLRERGNSILADVAYRTSKMDNLLENTAHALAMSPEHLAQPLEAVAEIGEHQAREKLAESHYEPLGLKALGKDFEETSERVRALAEPGAQLSQLTHATGEINASYPEQGAAMRQKLLGVYQHLNESLPQSSGGSALTPSAVKPRVSPREQARFLTRVNAALNPKQVIADIGAGKLDKDAVQTIKVLYPATFNLLQQKVEKYTAQNKDQMPFYRVIHISKVFDFAGDSSLEPGRFAGLQSSIAQINAGNPSPDGGPGAPGRPNRAPPRGSKPLSQGFALPSQEQRQ